MKRWWLTAALVLCVACLAVAQNQNPATPTNDQPAAPSQPSDQANAPAAKHGDVPPPPKGTKVTKSERETEVEPVKKQVKVTPDMVRAAQKELANRGFYKGTPDGRMGPATRAAVRQFQGKEGLQQTGRLDEDTLTKLNVGGGHTLGAAPGDIGRGGKAFGHNIKEGHPVAAGKGLGKGTINAGKKVGKGTKSLAVGGAEKVGHGLGKVGDKLSGGDKKEEKKPE